MVAAGRPRQRAAAERVIRSLRSQKRLRPEDAAIVALVRGVATALDLEPGRSDLWREYRLALEQLKDRAVVIETDPDGEAGFLDSVSTPLGIVANG